MSTTEDATASAFEVPVWEPTTGGCAIDTAMESAGRGMQWQGVGLWVFTVAVGVAFVWAWAIGARLTVVVLFGLVAVACMVLSREHRVDDLRSFQPATAPVAWVARGHSSGVHVGGPAGNASVGGR